MLAKFKRNNGTLIIQLVGELDHHYAKQVKEEIDSEIMKENTNRVIFELSSLTFMDSSGIGTILGRYKLMQSLGGVVEICGASMQVDKLLTMAGIKKIIKMTDAVLK